MTDPTWQDSLASLRERHGVPAALANATTLLAARQHWQHHVVARTSMHDLLFTLPGDGYPFSASVRVSWETGTASIQRRQGEEVVESQTVSAPTVDDALDSALQRLVGVTPVCRRCGASVVVSASQFDVFEQMHYLCFHFEFEHGAYDPDEECTAGGCPSASIGPAQRPEQPRDELVEDLLDALMTSSLGEEAANVRLDRSGPGLIRAAFDDVAFLITVRTEPTRRT